MLWPAPAQVPSPCHCRAPLHPPPPAAPRFTLATSPCFSALMQVGGAHWLSENMPIVVDVEAAKQGAGRTEGSIPCRVTYTGAALAAGSLCELVHGACGKAPATVAAHGCGLQGRLPPSAQLACPAAWHPPVHCPASLLCPPDFLYSPLPRCDVAAVRPDGSLLTGWEVDASDALPAKLAPGLDKCATQAAAAAACSPLLLLARCCGCLHAAAVAAAAALASLFLAPAPGRQALPTCCAYPRCRRAGLQPLTASLRRLPPSAPQVAPSGGALLRRPLGPAARAVVRAGPPRVLPRCLPPPPCRCRALALQGCCHALAPGQLPCVSCTAAWLMLLCVCAVRAFSHP